ncbi:MAG: AAA family ATPase [Neisseriaceae bacterium]|nr:MAG: AAA family ATPase [Neisseriaceae bacterium]
MKNKENITHFSEEELDQVSKEILEENQYTAIKPQTNPKVTVLGGLAGSGKSNYTDTLENTYVIAGDNYRTRHPRFAEIKERYGDDWVFKTNDFAGAMVKKISEQVVKDKKNAVIEGTFRTYEAPANTLKQFKEAGYETHAHIVLCHKDVAKASTVDRYYTMKESGLPGRVVTNEKFQEMLNGLAKTADKIKESGLVKDFTMSARRDLNQLTTIYKADDTRKPSEVINKEISRQLSPKEQEFIERVNKQHEQQQTLKALEKMRKNRESNLNKDRDLSR